MLQGASQVGPRIIETQARLATQTVRFVLSAEIVRDLGLPFQRHSRCHYRKLLWQAVICLALIIKTQL